MHWAIEHSIGHYLYNRKPVINATMYYFINL